MAAVAVSLSAQLIRRAATAQFIVNLEVYFTLQMAEPQRKTFVELPVPPDHLDRPAVEECRAIAAMMSLACKKIYQVSWDAEEYANDAPPTALTNPEVEARLMAKYPPLIGREEMVRRHDDNLPLLHGPGIVSDIKGHVLFWYLPQILSESWQARILADTRILEAQLTVDDVILGAPPTKSWRTAHTFYLKGSEWTSGSTFLSPTAFPQGQSGPGFDLAPSVDATSTRTHEWMRAFEESGGMLDGILAVTHPTLYTASQDLMEKMWRGHGVIRPVLSIWPSCFTSLQVIANRATPGHRDWKRKRGFFDILLSLGTYRKTAILEFHGLGISLPYSPGTVVPLASRILLHGVPVVHGDRICYHFFMQGDLYTRFKVPIVRMATVPVAQEHDGHVAEGPAGIAPGLAGLESGHSVFGGREVAGDVSPAGDTVAPDAGGLCRDGGGSSMTDGEDTEMGEA